VDRADEALDLDRVLPAVAEVIEIDKLLRSDVFEDVAESGLARIEEVVGPMIRTRRAPADVAGTQLVKRLSVQLMAD